MGRDGIAHKAVPFLEARDINTMSWDPIFVMENETLTPTKDLKEVHIGPVTYQVTKVETSLSKEEEECELVN